MSERLKKVSNIYSFLKESSKRFLTKSVYFPALVTAEVNSLDNIGGALAQDKEQSQDCDVTFSGQKLAELT